jgi:hypothetical protein
MPAKAGIQALNVIPRSGIPLTKTHLMKINFLPEFVL